MKYGHAYQLSVCTNVKTMDVRAYLRNGVKTETISYETDHTIRQNINFLLATTVLIRGGGREL